MQLHSSKFLAAGSAACLAVSMSFASIAQESVVDYDHSDPAVRADFLNYLHEIAKNSEFERYIGIAADLVPQWQAPDQVSDLRMLCSGLFTILTNVRVRGPRNFTDDCPQDVRDLFEGRVDRDPIRTLHINPGSFLDIPLHAGTEEIVVSFSITRRGRAKNVEIVSSTYEPVNEAIFKSARLSRFLPAIRDGKRVSTPTYFTKYVVNTDTMKEKINFIITDIGTTLDDLDYDGDLPPWDRKLNKEP